MKNHCLEQKRIIPQRIILFRKNEKMFLGAVKSEILDPRNKNKLKFNIPPEEVAALKELIKLKKNVK